MPLLQVNMQEMRVLVVDDSSTARRFMSEMLHEIGVGHIEGAKDGADAIEKLRQFPADIMLCDVHMTPLDGIELTRLLRNANDSPNPYLPIVLLTADATQAQMKNAVAAGANAFMSKPIKMGALHKKLQLIFSRPMVFVREGRNLRAVRATPASEGAPPRALAKKAPTDQAQQSPNTGEADIDDPLDTDNPSMTRREIGAR